jgi:hypothetical protein
MHAIRASARDAQAASAPAASSQADRPRRARSGAQPRGHPSAPISRPLSVIHTDAHRPLYVIHTDAHADVSVEHLMSGRRSARCPPRPLLHYYTIATPKLGPRPCTACRHPAKQASVDVVLCSQYVWTRSGSVRPQRSISSEIADLSAPSPPRSPTSALHLLRIADLSAPSPPRSPRRRH